MVGPVQKRRFYNFLTTIWCHFVLSHTHTEPISCSSIPVQTAGPQQGDGGMSKKRRKRRRKVCLNTGGGRREESGEEFSEDEDMFTIDMSSDEEGENDGSRCVYVNARASTTGSTEKVIWLWWTGLAGNREVCFLPEDSSQSEIETACRWFVHIRFSQLQKNVLRITFTGWKADMFVGHTPGICPVPTVFARPTVMFFVQWSKVFLESSPHAWLGDIPGTFRGMRSFASPSLHIASCKSSAFST